MKKMKQMIAVILAGILITGSMQISVGATETVPLDPEPVAEMPLEDLDNSATSSTELDEQIAQEDSSDAADSIEAVSTENEINSDDVSDPDGYQDAQEQSSESEMNAEIEADENESDTVVDPSESENGIQDNEEMEIIEDDSGLENSSIEDTDSSEADWIPEVSEADQDEEQLNEEVPEGFSESGTANTSENDSVDEAVVVDEGEDTENPSEEILIEDNQEIETTEEQAMFGDISYDVATEYDSLAYSIRSDCVSFVKYKVPSLPTVGDTLNSKKAIINSNTPVAGCVAIENGRDQRGHVSYVEAVNGSTVTTLHGGFQGAINGVDYTGRIIRKTGTPSNLGIVGYWIPGGGGGTPSQNPTNPTLTVNKTRFSSSDTIYLKAHADGAIRYYGAIYKGSARIWEGDCLEGGVIQYPASQFGAGQYSAYVSCTNYVGGVDTNWVNYTVAEDIGSIFYAFITTNWEKGWQSLGSAPNGNVQLVDSSDRYHPKQIWKFIQQNDGSYKIENMYWESYYLNTGKQYVLSCEGEGTANNTNVKVSSENGGSSQRWFIDYDSNNGFRFTPAHCSLAMDLTAGSTGIGTNIQLYQYNDSSAQRFDIYKLSKDNVTYSRPGKPSASVYNGKTEVEGGKSIALTWTESPKVNDFDKRSYRLQIFDSTGKEILNKSGLTDTKYNYTFNSSGIYSIKITTVNDYYKDYETAGSSTQISVGEVDKEKPVITSVNLIEASADRIVFEIDATDNKEIEYGSICFITYENDSTGQIFGTKDSDDVQLDFLSPSKLRYTLKKAAIDHCKETGQFIGDKQRFYFQVRDKSNNYSERYALDTEIPFGPFYYVDPGDTFTVDDLFGADLGEFWYKRVELNPDCFRKENDQYTAIKAGKSTLVYVHGSRETPAKACTVIVRGLLKINSQPDDQTVDEGAIVKMKASASGDDLKYQWYYQKSGSSKWEKATQTGNSSESITITAEKSLSDARFKCIVTDAYDRTVESRAAVLTVNEVIEPDEPVQITSQDVKLAKTSYVYNGIAKKPGVIVTCDGETLVLKTDYTVSYKNNLNAGTATVTITGKGDYTGTVKKTFNITAASIADATITGLKTRTYTGKALVQAPVVELNDSELQEDVDYTVSYKNNTKAGTATVTVKGIGNYTETASATFKINAVSIAKAAVTCQASRVWTGRAQTPVPTVKIGGKVLKKDTDYTLAYKNNKNVGTATVTIKGKGNYTGTINRTFRIDPKPTAISRVTPATGKLTLTWKKQATQTLGYQIQYSSRSDFKIQKTVKIASSAATSRALTGLTRKHKYFVRIRTYKQVGSKYYYSTWSAAKSATTK